MPQARTKAAPTKQAYKITKHRGVRKRPTVAFTISPDDDRRIDVVSRARGMSRSRLVAWLALAEFRREFGATFTLEEAEALHPEPNA